MPCVFQDEEDGDVHGHLPDRGRNTIFHTEVGRDGWEQPDLRELDGEVAQEDERCAFPLLLPSRNLLAHMGVSVPPPREWNRAFLPLTSLNLVLVEQGDESMMIQAATFQRKPARA